jgi:hypothetical protein
MSEAVNSREIEDVLLSIRRLVSDDLLPGLGEGATANARPAADKLLLTPALRVVSSNTAPKPAALALDAVVASVSAAVDQRAEDWESETGDLAPRADAAPMAVDVPEGAWDEHQIEAYAEPLMLQPEEPVSPETEMVSPQTEAELPGWAQTQGADEAEQSANAPWAEATVEPDRAWADAAEAAVLRELSANPRAAQMPVDEIEFHEPDLPETPIDEAMLREIVRDVLREELQGRLGERITRNIRKLVRAEIARTMASDDLL